jgi:hypothetical protein
MNKSQKCLCLMTIYYENPRIIIDNDYYLCVRQMINYKIIIKLRVQWQKNNANEILFAHKCNYQDNRNYWLVQRTKKRKRLNYSTIGVMCLCHGWMMGTENSENRCNDQNNTSYFFLAINIIKSFTVFLSSLFTFPRYNWINCFCEF